MRNKLLFKTLLLFGLAFISTATTAGDKNKSYYPTKGYRGSFEVAFADRLKKVYKDASYKSESRPDREYQFFQMSMAHGYQIIPELYVGVGAMIDAGNVAFGSRPEHRNESYVNVTFLPFATVRYDILKNRISPYIEGRFGYKCLEIDNNCDYDKLYAAPVIGVRFGNFNLAFSYECKTFGGDIKRGDKGQGQYYMTKRFSAVGFHVGFDFGARKKQ